ncbi:MAG: GDP-mannose 4,6-dehydratase [Rhodospirillaceae bacterium]|nr:GDP-mannose 4,6-dehydratase [Rhodospirillaceae bacterium]
MAERILITGITGFVGSHLADYVLSLGPKFQVFGTKRWHLSRMANIRHIADRITLVDCDLTDAVSVRNLIETVKPDRIFHCAAESFVSPSWKNPHRYMAVNYNGTVNLLDALYAQGLTDVPFHIPGSGEEYGDVPAADLPITPATVLRPVNPYAVTKIAQDLIGLVYHQSYGLHVIRTRAFNHEGPRREKVFGIPWYAYQIARIEAGESEPLMKVGHIEDRRNFTHVHDIVKAYWLATEHCKPGELYLVGSEDEASIHTFRDALEMLIEMSPRKGIRYEIDPQYVRPTQVPRLIADTRAFRKATGWEPELSFQNILTDTLEYWRARVHAGTA